MSRERQMANRSMERRIAITDRIVCALKEFFALDRPFITHSPTASPGRVSPRAALRLGPHRFCAGEPPRDEWACEWRGLASGRGVSALMRSSINDDLFVDERHSVSSSTPSLTAELYAQAELERPRITTSAGVTAATRDPPALSLSRRGFRLTSYGRYLVTSLISATGCDTGS